MHINKFFRKLNFYNLIIFNFYFILNLILLFDSIFNKNMQ